MCCFVAPFSKAGFHRVDLPDRLTQFFDLLKGVVYLLAEKLKIIPLGGLNEIGKNITVLEYGKDMIVVD